MQHLAMIVVFIERDAVWGIEGVVALVCDAKGNGEVVAADGGSGGDDKGVGRKIEGIALRGDIRHLSEEAVEGLGTIGESGGRVERVLRDRKVFVDGNRTICPLVPNLAG